MELNFTRNMTKTAAAMAIFAFGVSSCQKRRAPEFRQGEGEYVFAIDDYKDMEYPITTGKFKAPGSAVDADVFVASKEGSIIRALDAVDFRADLEIVNNFNSVDQSTLKFFAREDTSDVYKAKIGFTDNHMIVYKIANINDVATDELTYGIVNGEQAIIPILGYPLTKYTIEYVLDSRGKPTNQKTTIEKKFLSEATHFSIDANSPKYFDRAYKTNMIPAKLFDGDDEWFYEVSIVDGPLSTRLGQQIGAGISKFSRTSNAILVLDVNIPEEAEGLSGDKLPRIVSLPTFWADYRLKNAGDDAFLKEELVIQEDAGSASWKTLPYGLVDFKRALNPDGANPDAFRVTRLEVDDDYLSFIVASSDDGTAFHFSFQRDNEKIQGIPYPALDRRKYGFWQADRQFYPGEITDTEKYVAKNKFLARMYPASNDNVIEIFLTENTPDHPVFIEAIKDAMAAWDEAFVEAARGSDLEDNPIRIKLNLDKRVANGDVRYNKVSFYDFNIEVGGLLGYGPSVQDDRTGRIFSSTNHIYLRTYREGIYSNLKSYIRHRLGLFEGKEVPGVDYPDQVLKTVGTIDSIYTNPVANGTYKNDVYALQNSRLVREKAEQPINVV
ncbi:MAG: hypothetical protein HRU19_15320 [Pseudobacteriovorax sp.]|nr:hypothetical protein [Pseudobacteriovorax sp.]